MRIGSARLLVLTAVGLVGLVGCSVFPKLDDGGATNNGAPETTGSITPQPAPTAFAQEPLPPPAPKPRPEQIAAFWGIAY
jgi:hypothetical protein